MWSLGFCCYFFPLLCFLVLCSFVCLFVCFRCIFSNTTQVSAFIPRQDFQAITSGLATERQGESRRTGERVMGRPKRSLERCGHEPGRAGHHRKLEGSGSDSSPGASGQMAAIVTPWFQPSDTDCRLLASRPVREQISVVFKPPGSWYFVIAATGNWYKWFSFPQPRRLSYASSVKCQPLC